MVNSNELPVEEKEKALVLFVLIGVKAHEKPSENDIKKLHAYGWTDRNVLDASSHRADVLRHGTLFKILKMDV